MVLLKFYWEEFGEKMKNCHQVLFDKLVLVLDRTVNVKSIFNIWGIVCAHLNRFESILSHRFWLESILLIRVGLYYTMYTMYTIHSWAISFNRSGIMVQNIKLWHLLCQMKVYKQFSYYEQLWPNITLGKIQSTAWYQNVKKLSFWLKRQWLQC